MKQISLIFLLALWIPNSQAKFAAWVMDIPCTGIKLKVSSCDNRSYSNLSFYKKIFAEKKKKSEIILKGAVVKGEILETAPVACRPKQKLDLTRYKEGNYRGKEFLVLGKTCAEINKDELIIRATKSFCDTPGALEIRDCFYNKFQYTKKMIITESIQKL